MKRSLYFALIFSFVWVLSACGGTPPDTGEPPTADPIEDEFEIGAQSTYALTPETSVELVAGRGIVTYTKTSSTETTVTVNFSTEGLDPGAKVDIRIGNVEENTTGALLVTLSPLGSDGKSVTVVTETESGEAINYDALLKRDSYINVYLPGNDTLILANAEVGFDAQPVEFAPDLDEVMYRLTELNGSGIVGVAVIKKLDETSSIIEIELTQDVPGQHPAFLHAGNVEAGAAITLELEPVEATSKSSTPVNIQNSGFIYETLVTYDGYISVQAGPVLNAAAPNTPIVAGEVGAGAEPLEPVEGLRLLARD